MFMLHVCDLYTVLDGVVVLSSPVICSVPQNCTDPMRPKGLLFIAMSSQNKSKSLLQIYVVFGEQPTRAVRLGDKRSNRRDGRVRFARSRGERTNGSTLLREVHSRTCNSRQEVSFLVTGRKLSLQRLCFHRCLFVHTGGPLSRGEGVSDRETPVRLREGGTHPTGMHSR